MPFILMDDYVFLQNTFVCSTLQFSLSRCGSEYGILVRHNYFVFVPEQGVLGLGKPHKYIIARTFSSNWYQVREDLEMQYYVWLTYHWNLTLIYILSLESSRLIWETPNFGTIHIWHWKFMTWIFGDQRVSQKKFRA